MILDPNAILRLTQKCTLEPHKMDEQESRAEI